MAAAVLPGLEMVKITEQQVWDTVAQIEDPELPYITITELGIVQGVRVDGERVEVDLTPTYSGCPAFGMIKEQVQNSLTEIGCPDVKVITVYSPAWSTENIRAAGRHKLHEAGIAPPRARACLSHPVVCPRCGGSDNRSVSEFGSTPCQALMVCGECSEPFNRFKEL